MAGFSTKNHFVRAHFRRRCAILCVQVLETILLYNRQMNGEIIINYISHGFLMG